MKKMWEWVAAAVLALGALVGYKLIDGRVVTHAEAAGMHDDLRLEYRQGFSNVDKRLESMDRKLDILIQRGKR